MHKTTKKGYVGMHCLLNYNRFQALVREKSRTSPNRANIIDATEMEIVPLNDDMTNEILDIDIIEKRAKTLLRY